MRSQTRLILATIGLTLLIWVYADLISQETYDVTLTVKVSAPQGSESVLQVRQGSPSTPQGEWDTTVAVPVQVSLVGPKAAVADIEHLKRTQGLVLDMVVPDTETPSADVLRGVDIRERVSEWARKHSLRVADLNPPFIDLKVDRYVRIDLTVEATAGIFADKLQGPPRVEPATVKARLLASQRDRLPAADRKLEISVEQQLRTGSDESFEVPLSGLRWQGIEATYLPDRVKVFVQRRTDFTIHPITAIPLYELWPAYRPDQGQFHIEYEDGEPPIQRLEVMVPPGMPRLPTNTDVIAYITISPDDLKQATQRPPAAESAPAGTQVGIPREVKFIFGEGFEDVTVVKPYPTVLIRIVREDTAAAVP